MPRKKSRVLTDHELRLMDVLWRQGKATVASVVGRLSAPPLAYNTVLTTLRTLEQKGYIAHEECGRAYVYSSMIARDEAARSALRYLLDCFFGSSPRSLAIVCLMTQDSATATLPK
jgi:predicted transcriptional regulator